MKNYDLLLEKLLEQEKRFIFDSFSYNESYEIGNLLVEKANLEQKEVTIDISKNGQQLFHVALEGTSPNNDEWIKRKMRVVNLFFHSSYYVGMLSEKEGIPFEKDSHLPYDLYAAHGGSFPIIIKESGVVGTITVSGLASADDHQMIVDVLTKYFSE